MEHKRKITCYKESDSDLIESYLEEKYNQHGGARSNHSKKSKFTSRSKLTKSSLFRTILKKEDSESAKTKDLDVQLYLLNGSLDTLKNGEETFLNKF